MARADEMGAVAACAGQARSLARSWQWPPAVMRTRSFTRAVGLALAALALGCGEGPQTRACHVTADCADGQVCLSSGSAGVCAPPPFSVELREPAPGARIGVAGRAVDALVTLAADGAELPEQVNVVVNGAIRSVLPLAGRDGRAITYRGVFTPQAQDQGEQALWVAVVTAGGALQSDAVLVEVDGAPPAFEDLYARCEVACARDADLHVYATLREDHVAEVEAFTSLDGYQAPVALAPNGTYQVYAGVVPLGARPFPWFSHEVGVRVRVRDEVGNEATADAAAVEVTRRRWAHATGAVAVTSPAVLTDGSLLVGVNAVSDQVLHLGGDGGLLGSWTVGGRGITVAPSLGEAMSYLASDDGKLYALAADGSLTSCPQAGAVPGTLYTPAVGADPEVAYAGGSGATLWSWEPGSGACNGLGSPGGKAISGPAVIGADRLAVPLVDNLSHATIGVLSVGSVQVGEVGPMAGLEPCSRIDAPLVLQGVTAYAACSSGGLFAVDLGALAATHLVDLPAAATASPALFPDGALFLGTNDGRLHRLAPPAASGGAWSEAWSPAPDLGAPVTGVLVAAPDADGVVAYVVTAAGALHALDAAGATVWSTAGAGEPPLGAFALTFPTIAPAAEGRRPTLVVGSAEGTLYGVVVDGGLDPASPWPKSHHDLRNTGRAGAPLP